MARNSNLKDQGTTKLQARKRKILVANWGKLTRMAGRLKVTHEMVRLVYWGRRRSERVERALQRNGLWIPEHGTSVKVRRRRRNVKG